MTAPFVKSALSLIEKGFSIIPTGPDKRCTLNTWKPYQGRIMTPDEVKQYFPNVDRLALIGGKVSGNLECLDFDDPEIYAPFLELLAEHDPDLAESLVKRQTPSGGYHLIYRCAGPVAGNLKLACDQAGAVRIETRGEGGYFLIEPSPGYEPIKHSIFDTPIISADQVETIHILARMFDQRPQRAEHTPNPGQNNTGSPGSDYNSRHSVADILGQYGWAEARRTTAGTGYTRPGKDRDTSGVLLDRTDNFYVWSSNASPLEPGRSYDSFGLFAMYEHGGDFKAAAKSLGAQGYGTDKAAPVVHADPIQIVVTDVHSLLGMEIPPRKNLLAPIIQEQSLNMIHAWRGVGKTHVALGIAYAVSSGGEFLKWKSEAPRKVIYVDGEMPISALQERIAGIVQMNNTEPPNGSLRLITPDLQDGAMPDLATKEGQALVDSVVEEDTALIIVDNLSCLVRASGKENDAESWLSVAEWALRHRAAGRSILFIHHSGKGGAQRGTSKREDLLDTVLCLKHAADYDPTGGAQFEVNFEKARGLFGDDVKPFEAKLIFGDQGKPCWAIRDVEDSTLERAVELFNLGLKQYEISEELGVNKSTISRALRKAEQQGLIVVKGGKVTKERKRFDQGAEDAE